jgi:hypothetical protein
MGIHFRINVEHHLFLIKYQGVVEDSDLLTYQEILTHPASRPGMSALVDLREITQPNMTRAGIRHLAYLIEKYKEGGPIFRSATIATGDASYGMARMYELIRDGSPERPRVFRSAAEAFAWLDLPLDESLLDF